MANLLPSKHLVYFEVSEALHDQGCPVCRLGLRAVSRHLSALSYEGVNDPRARDELRAARGFCRQHAWQFAEEVRDGLGTAIIYRDLIGELLRILPGDGEGGRPRPSPRALAARLAPQRECPACRLQADSSRRYLDTLLSHLGDEAFRARYLASDGLCLPHLSLALRHLADERHRSFLAHAFARRMASLATGPRPDPHAHATAILEALVGKEGATPQAEPQVPDAVQPGDVLDGQAPFPLDEVAGQVGCPVCLSVAPAMERWLARLLQAYEAGVPRPACLTPASLCNAHAWRLLRTVGASGMLACLRQLAVAAAEVAEEAVRHSAKGASWRRRLASLLLGEARSRPAAGQNQCPACAAQAAMEKQAALALLAATQRGRAAEQDAPPPELCLPHLRVALNASSALPEVEALTAGQVGGLVTLRWQLGEYIRKQDYRFRHEPLGAEADAPWRAIAQVAGAREA